MNEKRPRFCGQCGARLPLNDPRFCIECGRAVPRLGIVPTAVMETTAASAGPTVQLPNAGSTQSVVGGTVKLPSSGAVPPGLWFKPELPGPDDIVAVYAPLRAVKGGWSGLTSHGWRRVERAWSGAGTRDRLLFEVERTWFAADGGAAGHWLRVRIGAESQAEEGRVRLGFRYRIGRNPPMHVLDALWLDTEGRACAELPPPQIQLMAPPRVARVSDFAEEIGRMGARAAHEWALGGAVHGVFRLVDFAQQRTPFGRGLRLLELPPRGGMTAQLGALFETRYRVRIERPLICDAPALEAARGQAQEEASGLGLDMESDAVIEWWLERHGYDGAVLAPGAHSYGDARMAVVFRRSQVARVNPIG
jgi:hypothetical protein